MTAAAEHSSPQEQLLLNLAGPQPPLDDADFDWAWVVRWAVLHDVAPLLLHALGERRISPPPHIHNFLGSHSADCLAHAQRAAQEVSSLQSNLAQKGLETMRLPSPAHAPLVPRWLDLFVRPHEIQVAIGLLDELGCARVRPAKIGSSFRSSESFILYRPREGNAAICLRWKLPGRVAQGAKLEQIWRRSHRREHSREPSALDCVLLHALLGAEQRWRFLAQIHALRASVPAKLEPQWKELTARASALGCKERLLVGLALARRYAGLPLAERLLSRETSGKRTAILAGVARSFFAFPDAQRATLDDLQWDWPLFDSAPARFLYLAKVLLTPTPLDQQHGLVPARLARPARLVRRMIEIRKGPRAAETRAPQRVSSYLGSQPAVVDAMLELAGVRKEDVVYDLGCGDGRIVIRAAQRFGARGVGVDLDATLLEHARENAREAGVASLVSFRAEDMLRADISEATVVTLFLPPQVHLQLAPLLESKVRAGTRIVTHGSDIGRWEEARSVFGVGFPQAIFLRVVGS